MVAPAPGVAKLLGFIERNGLTRTAFAEQAKVPSPQVSLWLSAARRPSIASALKIQAATRGEVAVEDWAAPVSVEPATPVAVTKGRRVSRSPLHNKRLPKARQ